MGEAAMRFSYVGKKPSGQVVKGAIEAESIDKAEESLWKSEITIVSLKQKRTIPSGQELFPTLYGVKKAKVVSFTRDLHTLLSAGIAVRPRMGMRRWACTNTTTAAVMTTINIPSRSKEDGVISPEPSFNKNIAVVTAWGKRATIPAKMINEIPLPTPRSVICSPIYIISITPVVMLPDAATSSSFALKPISLDS
jgi:hypothetical protein